MDEEWDRIGEMIAKPGRGRKSPVHGASFLARRPFLRQGMLPLRAGRGCASYFLFAVEQVQTLGALF